MAPVDYINLTRYSCIDMTTHAINQERGQFFLKVSVFDWIDPQRRPEGEPRGRVRVILDFAFWTSEMEETTAQELVRVHAAGGATVAKGARTRA